MQPKINYVDIETRQYYHQANLVYLSTIGLDLIIIPILYFTGSMVSFYGNIIGIGFFNNTIKKSPSSFR